MSTRGGVEDIKISRQLRADAEKETEGAIRSGGGNLRNLHSTPENGLECGSTVRARAMD